MKTGFYPKLAFDGIRKNRRMYVPFICTCIGMVMMFYIISYLHYSDYSCCYARWRDRALDAQFG